MEIFAYSLDSFSRLSRSPHLAIAVNDEKTPPPLDRWARLAVEDRRSRHDGFKFLLLILIVAALVYLIQSRLPDAEKRRKRLIARETINNLRQIGLGLLEFESDYGKFPDASTIAEVKKKTGTNLTFFKFPDKMQRVKWNPYNYIFVEVARIC